MRFSSCLINDEITMRGYMTLSFVKCKTIMIDELTVMSGHGTVRSIVTLFLSYFVIIYSI
jgi:hypothetical protein